MPIIAPWFHCGSYSLGIGFLSFVALSVLATSFLSGIFGMAGGMVLMGLLLVWLPVSTAMVLHGTAQMTSNGWRALMWRRHADYRIFARYIVGLMAAGALFSFVGFVPDRALVLISLGIIPFLAVLLPARVVPQANTAYGAEVCGFLNTCMQFIAGVSGPLLDAFFVRSDMDRRAVVATKAACQTFSHLAKLIYFFNVMGSGSQADTWALSIAVAMAIVGASLGKLVLERLSDHQFRRWTQRLVMAIGTVYLAQGIYMLMTR